MSKKWFIIEGNIGSGKSTLLEKLKGLDNVEVIQEPVDKWLTLKDENNKNLLDHFYSDMERNAYMFQSMVFKTRIESLDKPQIENTRFSERSIWTDKYVFGKSCIESKKMNSMETVCYNYWFDFLEEKFKPKPNGIFYIRCSPQKCLERIGQRGRNEEDSIKLEYLEKLHQYHDEWLLNFTKTPVLTLDNESDNNWDLIINKIKSFTDSFVTIPEYKVKEPEVVNTGYSYFD